MSKPEAEKELSPLDLVSADGIEPGIASTTTQLNEERAELGETSAANSHRKHATIFAGVRQFLAHRWAEGVLGAIIVSASVLSLFWVFKVPILQNPDETSHIDYAFSIYSAGRLLNVRRAPSEWNVHARPGALQQAAWERISHQYTLYLIDSTDFQRLRFHYEEKVPPNYGTADYYRKLDLNAPQSPAKVTDLTPQDNPWLVAGYPFGYYALVAIWLKLLSLFSSRLLVLFFGARILSVILLAGSLVLTYVTLRELRLSKWRSLALTAMVAFFPMTTFLSSSVQPDTLSWALMSLCFYLALRLRRKSGNRLWALLGTALGLLLITKYHFYLFALAPILGLVVSEHLFKRRRGRELLRVFAILLLPSVLLFAVQLWVVWGDTRITGGNLQFAAAGQVQGVKKALLDYYRGGPAFVSWWGTFGWMDAPLIIRSPIVQWRVLLLLYLLTPVVLVLVFFRLEQVLTRLVVLAARGRWRMASRIAFSNPLINSHFIFSAFMILLSALHDKGFAAQGRHWFPYILPSFLITIQFAPRALTHRKTQAALSALLILGLVVYCVVGSYYSIETIKQRYYAAQTSAKASGG